MKNQSANHHTRLHPLQHFVWLPLSFILLLSTILYIIVASINGTFTVALVILLGAVILAIIPGMLARTYALTLQDRLIRTEEQFRYYMLTNNKLDARITIEQLIALRFAPDEEFVKLVERTIAENLSPTDIKQAVRMWRTDYRRV